jgi:hypothetical protein
MIGITSKWSQLANHTVIRRETFMSHKNRLHVFVVLLTIIGLLFNLGTVTARASTSNLSTASPEATTTATAVVPPSTPTPVVKAGSEPQAWLDGAIDPEQFGPMQSLVVHFNAPMSPASSTQPVLSWPSVQGVSSWDSTGTILTFKTGSSLDASKTYTFFLDPALRSEDEGYDIFFHAFDHATRRLRCEMEKRSYPADRAAEPDAIRSTL